jgi:putative NADH-flavin reductase
MSNTESAAAANKRDGNVDFQPMNLLVVGATGRTGRLLTELALRRGHKVSALVHSSPVTMPRANQNLGNLRIVKGDALNAADMVVAIEGQDAVVSILGGRSKLNRTLLEDGAAAMLKALRNERSCRYIVVSSGLLFADRRLFIAALRLIFRKAVADCTAMENLVMASDVMWTIVRPPRLTEGGASEYCAKAAARPEGALSLTRATLAAFLLDEVETCRYPRTLVGLG